jgi:hypothetical protein
MAAAFQSSGVISLSGLLGQPFSSDVDDDDDDDDDEDGALLIIVAIVKTRERKKENQSLSNAVTSARSRAREI